MSSTDIVIQGSAWLPQNYAEVERMATDMAEAKLVPAQFQKSRGDCMQVIRLALVWEMDPFMLAQECYAISGRLMPSGKLAAAVINARGKLAERLNYEYSGEGEERVITVSGRLESEAVPRTVTIRLKDAKTANEQWKKQPDQQLMYAGARTWGRRHVPELLLGVTFYEEADAIPPQAPRVVRDLPKIQTPRGTTTAFAEADEIPGVKSRKIAIVDPDTGEVLELTKPYKIEPKSYTDFVSQLTEAILHCESIAEYDQWVTLNQETLLKLKEKWPDPYKLFEKNIEVKHEELTAKWQEQRQ